MGAVVTVLKKLRFPVKDYAYRSSLDTTTSTTDNEDDTGETQQLLIRTQQAKQPCG